MKKLALSLLAVCLALCVTVPAFAQDVSMNPDEENSPEVVNTDPTAVFSLDELLTTIDKVKDGDTIAVGKTIFIESDCSIGESDKHITLIRAPGFTGNMIEIHGGIVSVTMIDFDGQNDELALLALGCSYASLTLEKCNFYNNATGALYIGANCKEISIIQCKFANNYAPLGMGYSTNLIVEDSRFTENNGLMSCIDGAGNIAFKNCIFERNYTSGADAGVILYKGVGEGLCNVESCTFIENTTAKGRGAAICSEGKTIISKCTFVQNNSGVAGNDLAVFDNGCFSIFDTDEEMGQLYELAGLQYEGVFIDEVGNRYKEGSSPLKLPLIDCAADLSFGAHEKVEIPPTIDAGDNNSPVTPNPSDAPGNTGTQVVYVPIYIEVPKPTEDNKPPISLESPTQTQPPRTILTNGILFIERKEYLDGCKNILGLSNTVTRSAAAQLLYGLIDKDCSVNTAYYAYNDVLPDSFCTHAISVLSNAGIFCGCNGKFTPDMPLTQGEAVTMLARIKGVRKGAVTTGHWAEPYLLAIQEYGIATDIAVASLSDPVTPTMLLEMITALFATET